MRNHQIEIKLLGLKDRERVYKKDEYRFVDEMIKLFSGYIISVNELMEWDEI